MSATLPNLTRTWLTHREAQGDTRADALRWLNGHNARGYTSSRLNEWLRGDRQPDRTARIRMMRDMLPHALCALGAPELTPDHYDDLSEDWT